MAKIAVIGDLIEDIFIYGSCERLNPEGSAPLITHKKTVRKHGGAGNVVENLRGLGLVVDFYHANTPPSRKTRINSESGTLCRFDEDVISPPVKIDSANFDYDIVILSDYNKGALQNCSEIINSVAGKVFVDPKRHLDNYQNAYCIKPNRLEFEQYHGPVTEENLRWFAIKNNHELVIVTLGKDGVIYCYEDQVYTIPAISDTVADVTGAGDCFMAAMVYAIAKGYGIHDAIRIGNIGAGVSVSHKGTYTLKIDDLIKTKVFTNGCFDVIHRGHIELLEKSKAMGDYLVVGINSDASVKRLKGETRPFNNEQDRKKTLEALKFVDEVVIFDEDTPYELIKQVKPDIITKGGDYKPQDVVGNDLAIVKIIPFVEGYSTTKILGDK